MSINYFDDNSLDQLPFKAVAGNIAIDALVAGRKKCYKSVSNIQSSGASNSVFVSNGQSISFLLPLGAANTIDICESTIVELNLTNNDAVNAAILLPAPYMLLNYQTLASGSVLETNHPESLEINRVFFSRNDEEIEQRQSLESFAYTLAGGYTTSATTIPASGTATLYLQLFSILDRCKLFLPAINTQITLQLYFNSTAVTSGSLSTTVSLTSTKLIMSGYSFENEIRNSLIRRFAQVNHKYHYYLCQKEIVSSETVGDVSESNVRVSSFSGMKLAANFFMVRTANAVQENLYTFNKMATVDLRANGSSVYLSQLALQEFQSMAIESIPTTAPVATNIVMLPHSMDTYASVKNGKFKGELVYSPNYNLLIKSTLAPASKDIVFIGYQSVIVNIKNGNLTIDYL